MVILMRHFQIIDMPRKPARVQVMAGTIIRKFLAQKGMPAKVETKSVSHQKHDNYQVLYLTWDANGVNPQKSVIPFGCQ